MRTYDQFRSTTPTRRRRNGPSTNALICAVAPGQRAVSTLTYSVGGLATNSRLGSLQQTLLHSTKAENHWSPYKANAGGIWIGKTAAAVTWMAFVRALKRHCRVVFVTSHSHQAASQSNLVPACPASASQSARRPPRWIRSATSSVSDSDRQGRASQSTGIIIRPDNGRQ